MRRNMPNGNIRVKQDNSHWGFAAAMPPGYNRAMKVNKIRKAKGLSQADLAEMVGVTQATISKLENLDGGCTIGKYIEYAAALGVTLQDLFADDRTAAESVIIRAFRHLPPDRQAGWLDMAKLAKNDLL